MKRSIPFWIYAIVLGRIFERIPYLNANIFVMYAIYFVVLQLSKLLFFPRCPFSLRYNYSPTIIVTGASSGIGVECAIELVRRGAKVIWACRDIRKARQALDDLRWTANSGPRGYVLYLDLASKESIREFVGEVTKREDRLDILVLNAGFHGDQRKTVDGFEQTIAVNHLGHMYLTYLLRDLIKQSVSAEHPGRIVTVSSDLHRWSKPVRLDDMMYENGGYTAWGSYNHSKLCNILFSRKLSQLWKDQNIVCHSVHPGTPVQTALMYNNVILGNFFMRNIIMPIIYAAFCRIAADGAQNLIHVAIAPECLTYTGGYYENLKRDSESKLAQDDVVAEKLWLKSNELLQIDSESW